MTVELPMMMSIVMTILMFGVLPIIASVVIFKHAKAHPGVGNPWGFAIMAVVIPLYLGIIYYLFQYDEYQSKKYNEEHEKTPN